MLHTKLGSSNLQKESTVSRDCSCACLRQYAAPDAVSDYLNLTDRWTDEQTPVNTAASLIAHKRKSAEVEIHDIGRASTPFILYG